MASATSSSLVLAIGSLALVLATGLVVALALALVSAPLSSRALVMAFSPGHWYAASASRDG